MIDEWYFYNYAAVPATAPHETPDLAPIKDGSIWHIHGKRPFMARYTTNWDCGYDTGWWYCIKDTPFDISALKTKRRYEITKALRFFDVKEVVNPIEYAESLALVQEQSYLGYPKNVRPIFNKCSFIKFVETWPHQINSGKLKVFVAFYKETSEVVGYSYIVVKKNYIDFSVLKTNPNFEKYNVNAALVNGILEAFKDKLSRNCYICDGARSINHESHFQDYLEKYFGFRKAYCKLHLAYPPLYKFMITLFSPFGYFIEKLGLRIKLFHLLSVVLKMEKIARSCK